MAFAPPTEERSWPSKVLAFNPALRLTAGLSEAYNTVRLKQQQLDPGRAKLHTLEDGRLWLSTEMPLLARRYRYLRTLSESDLSQIICAVDTYRDCTATSEVAIKLMNAQHWVLGAQEYERLRLLWRALEQASGLAAIVRPRAFFEQGDHFCIVYDKLNSLNTLVAPAPPRSHCSATASVQLPASSASSASAVPSTAALSPTLVAPKAALWAADSLSGGTATGGLLAPLPSTVCTVSPRAAALLDIGTVRHAAAQLLGSLVFLRSQGVLHADVKPDNIMVERRRCVA